MTTKDNIGNQTLQIVNVKITYICGLCFSTIKYSMLTNPISTCHVHGTGGAKPNGVGFLPIRDISCNTISRAKGIVGFLNFETK